MVKSFIEKKTLKCRIPFASVLALGTFGAMLMGYQYALIN
jgi:hypothetical protein